MTSDELKKAKEIFESQGKKMMADSVIMELINEYRHAIKHTWKTMRSFDITGTCSSCAEKTPGGCCFKGVEEWYSHIQLFINLLLGAEIPDTPVYPDSCMFVGAAGCRLISRNAFCINFLCDKIKALISTEDINRLNRAAGKEIECGIRLENEIASRLTVNIR